jgi:hypothetical protein
MQKNNNAIFSMIFVFFLNDNYIYNEREESKQHKSQKGF